MAAKIDSLHTWQSCEVCREIASTAFPESWKVYGPMGQLFERNVLSLLRCLVSAVMKGVWIMVSTNVWFTHCRFWNMCNISSVIDRLCPLCEWNIVLFCILAGMQLFTGFALTGHYTSRVSMHFQTTNFLSTTTPFACNFTRSTSTSWQSTGWRWWPVVPLYPDGIVITAFPNNHWFQCILHSAHLEMNAHGYKLIEVSAAGKNYRERSTDIIYDNVHIKNTTRRWLIVRQRYIQCIRIGVTTVLH